MNKTTGSLAALNAAVVLTPGSQPQGVTVVLAGTWVGSVAFEGSSDGGLTWSAISTLNSGNAATANGTYSGVCAGNLAIRARLSAYTSGTVGVSVISYDAFFNGAGSGGGGVILPTGYDAVILAEPSLVHYWPLNESSGTTAVDAKGSANGTYSGTVTLGGSDKNLQDGESLPYFGGGGVSFTPSFPPAGSWSLEFWAIADAANMAGSSNILQWQQNYGFLTGTAFGCCHLFLPGGGGRGPSIQSPQLIHFVLTYDGAQTRVYMDGALAKTMAGVVGGSGTLAFMSASYSYSATDGEGGKVALYSSALTPTDVAYHYMVGSGAIPTGVPIPLIAQYL